MRILMVCTNDPAGMGIDFTDAINRYTKHTCRLVTTSVKYNFMYRKDLHLPWLQNYEELESVLRMSDIVHFHAFADEHMQLGPFRVGDYLGDKGVVYHQHGEPLRSDPGRFRAMSGQKKFLVSTPDLLELLPGATWIPNLVPVDDPAYRPPDRREEGRVRIGQSPTRKEIKDTALLLRVYSGLKAKHNGFLDLDIIENTSHSECLKRKGSCHIFFDHLQGYYGVSSLEALSQGTPTIAGLSSKTRAHVEAFTGTTDLPWVEARDGNSLEQSLTELILDAERRLSIGRRSRTFMERHWHPSQVVHRLTEVYRSL